MLFSTVKSKITAPVERTASLALTALVIAIIALIAAVSRAH